MQQMHFYKKYKQVKKQDQKERFEANAYTMARLIDTAAVQMVYRGTEKALYFYFADSMQPRVRFHLNNNSWITDKKTYKGSLRDCIDWIKANRAVTIMQRLDA